MAGITTCQKCGQAYEAGSEEQANESSGRRCRRCRAKRTKIEGGDWTMRLAEAVEDAAPGDIIEVMTWHAAQAGHVAARSVKGTEEHGILFECGGRVVDYLDADEPPAGSGFDEDGFPIGVTVR